MSKSASSEKLRIVVADDERPARAFLLTLLEDVEDVEVVGDASSGGEAIELIERLRPDLALLDLQMPEVDGLDVVRLLETDSLPLIAFVTAYDEYAVRAFELNAVDYLLKPVDAGRLALTLDRVRERLSHAETPEGDRERLKRVVSSYVEQKGPEPLERIPIRKRDKILILPVAQIASIESEGELLHITTTQGERHVISGPLKDLEARLDEARFFRISRGALVKVDCIVSVSPMPGGSYVVNLSTGNTLPVSRQRSRVLRETILRV